MTLSNKDKAVALLNSLESGDQTAITYINADKYIQHNLSVGDGLAGLKDIGTQNSFMRVARPN